MPKKLIKSEERVRKFGEVFTPDWMVEKMLDTPGIKEECENIFSTFLEPAAGDGNFLVAILERKLNKVIQDYSKSLKQFENFSLYALSTLYGIELLEDNAQKCAINMATYYQKVYFKIADKFGEETKDSVVKSASHIISKNIVQGDFLKRTISSGEPIIFIDWNLQTKIKANTVNIRVLPTEYTLDDIYENHENTEGLIYEYEDDNEQLDMFSILDKEDSEEVEKKEITKYKYKTTAITNVYKELVVEDV